MMYCGKTGRRSKCSIPNPRFGDGLQTCLKSYGTTPKPKYQSDTHPLSWIDGLFVDTITHVE